MNKRNTYIFEKWLKSNKCFLGDCYTSFSDKKQNVYDYCISECKKVNGHRLRIIGSNCHFFSVAFVYKKDDNLYLMYITKGSDTEIKLDEESAHKVKELGYVQ